MIRIKKKIIGLFIMTILTFTIGKTYSSILKSIRTSFKEKFYSQKTKSTPQNAKLKAELIKTSNAIKTIAQKAIYFLEEQKAKLKNNTFSKQDYLKSLKKINELAKQGNIWKYVGNSSSATVEKSILYYQFLEAINKLDYYGNSFHKNNIKEFDQLIKDFKLYLKLCDSPDGKLLLLKK